MTIPTTVNRRSPPRKCRLTRRQANRRGSAAVLSLANFGAQWMSIPCRLEGFAAAFFGPQVESSLLTLESAGLAQERIGLP
jgi:hypothetical protein